MNEKRKEEIIMSTLKLASQQGLGGVSMNMIAEDIGIKKPSLYNHFKSKEELVNEMYLFLRGKAQKQTNTQMDFNIFDKNSAYEILSTLVNNYILLSSEPNIQMFYKVIYSERTISSEAANILAIETNKMINATTEIFKILENKKLLQFRNIDICATSFALTIHGLMDYSLDQAFANNQSPIINTELIHVYIENFCNEHCLKEDL